MGEQGFPISYRTVHRRLKEAKINLKKAQKWMESKDPKFHDKKNVETLSDSSYKESHQRLVTCTDYTKDGVVQIDDGYFLEIKPVKLFG